jgi:uncharacterized small protein (DUF1192 family)
MTPAAPRQPHARAPNSQDLRSLAAGELRKILEADTTHDIRARDVKVRAAQVVLHLDQSELLDSMSDRELDAHAEQVAAEIERRKAQRETKK